MNSATLVGSLIFAAVLVVVITVLIQLMMRSWQRRAQRQQELIGELPDLPDNVGAAAVTTRGHYCGSMMAPDWGERIAAGDLGFRSKAVMTRYHEGSWWKGYGPNPFGFRKRRSKASAWSAEWPVGSRPGSGYWRSGGDSRREPRSTPPFGRTTATNTTPGWTAGRRGLRELRRRRCRAKR